MAFGNLAVGAAHSHFERADEHFALAWLDGRNVLDACRVRVTRLRDERLHYYAAVSPPSITKTLPVTKLAASEAR